MTRYVSRIRPHAEDDFYPNTHQTMTVIVEDADSVDTGLVDHLGVPIMRVSERIPVGFKK